MTFCDAKTKYYFCLFLRISWHQPGTCMMFRTGVINDYVIFKFFSETLTVKYTPWCQKVLKVHHEVKTYVIKYVIASNQKYVTTPNVMNYVMTSKGLESMSLCKKKVRSLHQEARHDVKKYGKYVRRSILTYVISQKLKVRHNIKKYIITLKG